MSGPSKGGGTARDALIEAARERFTEAGYACATTLDIAGRAGVSETLIFRYFGSKSGLFVAAVLAPMADFIGDLLITNQTDARADADIADDYISRLASALPRAGKLPIATAEVLSSHGGEPHVIAFRNRIVALFERLAVDMGAYLAQRGLRAADPDVAVRTAFLTVAAVSALLPFTYPDGEAPADDRVARELSSFLLHGLQPPAEVNRANRGESPATRRSHDITR